MRARKGFGNVIQSEKLFFTTNRTKYILLRASEASEENFWSKPIA